MKKIRAQNVVIFFALFSSALGFADNSSRPIIGGPAQELCLDVAKSRFDECLADCPRDRAIASNCRPNCTFDFVQTMNSCERKNSTKDAVCSDIDEMLRSNIDFFEQNCKRPLAMRNPDCQQAYYNKELLNKTWNALCRKEVPVPEPVVPPLPEPGDLFKLQ